MSPNESLKNRRFGDRALFFTALLAGALLFILTYGTAVLDFTYDSWIFRIKDVDIHQHYLGWCHFRVSPWSFPPGLMDSLSYPYKMSVIWTDSIPLFAIFFKCFRSLLPETFQYFGFYGLLSFALTGAMGALLIKKLTGSDICSLLSVPFFAESFPMLQRMFYHTSLTAHYLIIIPLLFRLYDGYRWSVKKKCLIWGSYFFFTVMLHPYLWAMGAVIALFTFIEEIVLTKDFRPAVITGLVSAVLTYVSLFLCGAFYGSVSAAYKPGGFEANLNTFINPLDMSRLLPPLPLQNPNQYEGFAYLGAGGILLLLIAFILLIIMIIKKDGSLLKREYALIILCPVFFLMSVFPDITINQKLLFKIALPEALELALGIFRSNGRFIWCSLILLYAAAVTILVRKGSQIKKYFPLCVLVLCLLLQFFDMSREITSLHEKFTGPAKPWHSDLENEVLSDKLPQYKHIVLVTDDSYIMERSAYFAVRNGLTVNRYYFARNIDDKINESLNEYHELCKGGNAPEDVIFVFDEETLPQWKADTGLHFYDLTGTIVGLSDELPLPEL